MYSEKTTLIRTFYYVPVVYNKGFTVFISKQTYVTNGKDDVYSYSIITLDDSVNRDM
jgi:hypothetical protein